MRRIKFRQALFDFFIFGTVTCLFAYGFFLQVASQNWAIQLPGWYTMLTQTVLWIFVSVLCGSVSVLIGLISYSIPQSIIRMASLVIIIPYIEILRSYVLGLIAYGPGGSIAANYNWGSFAVVASGTPFVYASRIVGFFGLSAFVIAFVLSVFLLFLVQYRIIGTCLCVGIVIITCIGWRMGAGHKPHSLQTVIVHLQDQDVMDYWRDWQSIPDHQDVIVLPEYSGLLDNPTRNRLAEKLNDNGVIITSQMFHENKRTKNQLVVMDKSGKVISTQDKTFLIPSGEYMPYAIYGLTKLFNQQRILDSFEKSQRIYPGTQAESALSFGGNTYGALVCSGVLSPVEYLRLVNQGADVLTNSASLSFMTNDSTYHVAGQNMARFQAVYNNRPFLQASRSGRSYIFDAQGSMLVYQDRNATTILQTKILTK